MRVLVVDDEPISRLRLTHALEQWGYEVAAAASGDEALQQVEQADVPLLLVVDWMMPGMDGVELCRRLRADDGKRFHYVIVLTSRSSTEDIVTALEAGADDFVAKPYHPDEMKVRVRAGMRILQLQHELQVKASHDVGTGLFNRRMTLELLDREVSRLSRGGFPFSVVMVDIDHFKAVNDTHGHAVGDDVLRQTAERMSTALRAGDVLGRYGGEEFLIVLPHCEEADALDVVRRVLASVRATPMDVAGLSIPVTISAGLATGRATAQPLSRDALMRAADDALYRAKRAGRDRLEAAIPPAG
jgi:two-component system cell cycle response regulator